MEQAALSDPALASPRIRRFEDLPGPRGIPIFGNALQLDKQRTHHQFADWAREFGKLYRLRLGNRRIVVVSDHQQVAAILRDRPEGFRRSTRLEQIWTEMGLPAGVFGANGEVWKRQRRMVMAGFDPVHVKAYFPSMQAVAGRLAGRWQRATAEGRSIDLQSDLMRFTVDTIAGLAFGSAVNTLESDHVVIQQHLDKIFPKLFDRMYATVPWWRLARSATDRQLEISLREVMRTVDGFVAQGRARLAAEPARRERPSNLLEAMLAAADLPDSGIDDQAVAGNVLTMLLAGEDTTANTLAWMIHLLWRHPETLTRATEEVRRVCGGAAAPTIDQLARLDYLEACAHETMRLKPVAPINVLQTSRDTVVGDVQVPAGMIVVALMRHDSIDEALVPEAAAFRPERWLADGANIDQAQSVKRISMPFGAGPRICPGRYLALLEIKVAMVMLLGRFDIRSVDTPDGGEAREHLAFTMAPVGLSMRLANRAGIERPPMTPKECQ